MPLRSFKEPHSAVATFVWISPLRLPERRVHLSSLRFKRHYGGFTDSDNTKAPYFPLQHPCDVSLTLLYYMEDVSFSFESKEHKFGLGIIAFLSSPRHKNHTLPTFPSLYPNIISFKMIDTLNSTHYLPVLPETSCIYPEGMRDKSTHEFKKKKKE